MALMARGDETGPHGCLLSQDDGGNRRRGWRVFGVGGHGCDEGGDVVGRAWFPGDSPLHARSNAVVARSQLRTGVGFALEITPLSGRPGESRIGAFNDSAAPAGTAGTPGGLDPAGRSISACVGPLLSPVAPVCKLRPLDDMADTAVLATTDDCAVPGTIDSLG